MTLPEGVWEGYVGLQAADGLLLALWNDASGSTRAIVLGPAPAWYYAGDS